MKVITVQDCEELKQKFDKYCETAEQHEFGKLIIVGLPLDLTVKKIRAAGEVADQKDIRAMFRVVLRTIGEDPTEYQEEEEQNGSMG